MQCGFSLDADQLQMYIILREKIKKENKEYNHSVQPENQIFDIDVNIMDDTNTAAWLILGTCLVIIIVLGVFGNSLSLIIWTRGKRCSSNRGAIYLRLLALSDILVLCIPTLELTVALLKPALILRDLNPVFCKVFPISPFFCVQLSTWIVVCLTVEQTIVVCRPFKSMVRSSKWRQYGIILIVTIVSFLDNLPRFLASNWGDKSLTSSYENVSDLAAENNDIDSDMSTGSVIDTTSTESFTASQQKYTQRSASMIPDRVLQNGSYQNPTSTYACVFESFSSPWYTYIVQLGMISVVPIVILTTCNIIILTKLLRQKKKLTKGDSRRDGRGQSSLVSIMTVRTVAISIVQCVTTLPIMSWVIYFLFHTADNSTIVPFRICNTIYYLNNAINVLFYCVLGQSFRQDCVALFTRKSDYGFKSSRKQTTTETVSM